MAERIEIKTEPVQSSVRSISTMAESIETKTEPVQSSVRSISTMAEGIDIKTEPVQSSVRSISTMAEGIDIKTEPVQSSVSHSPLGRLGGRLRIQDPAVRVKLRNVRLRKPNWTPKESLDLLDEFDKHKSILNSRGNTGGSTKVKRKMAWNLIANRINSKGYSAVKRTVYECKRRWKNMVTFAKLSILEYAKAIRLGGDPAKTVTDMERRITDVHGDVKLLLTLEFAENRDLVALSDVVEVEPIHTDRPSSTTHVEGNIELSPTSILGNYASKVSSLQGSNRHKGPHSPRRTIYESVSIENDVKTENEISMQTIEEQTPAIESYYSLPPEHFAHTNGLPDAHLGGPQEYLEDPRFVRGAMIDGGLDPNEASMRNQKLKLEVDKLQLEKEVLELQKVKIRLETKAWRRFLGQRSTPPPQPQAPAPFPMAPFYWPSPTPGFSPFYGSAPPAMGTVGMPGTTKHNEYQELRLRWVN